jgi:polysaccharide pyruvyl transferase WcaK-like protein
MNQIHKHLPAEFTFAVDPTYIDLEDQWATLYGVKVAPRDTLSTFFRRSYLFRALLRLSQRLNRKAGLMAQKPCDWNTVHKQYVDAFQKTDCIINLNGIAFVGEETRSWMNALTQRTDSIYARRLNKPFFRFIQSYGPFKDWRVKLLARSEFKRLPCVMARGRLSESHCKEVSRGVPVYSFPDVAITLSCADDTWLEEYLNKFGLETKGYIVLSPSAVIASMPTRKNSSVGHRHIDLYAEIAKHYISRNKALLFLPHMTSPDPINCDRRVCEAVLRKLSTQGIDTASCYCVDDELDCRELKTLIKASQLAIVSRYHALVAALSTGVPVVSIGWNEKYQDLLEFYESGEFAIDVRAGGPEVVSNAVLRKTQGWTNKRIERLKNSQPELECMVDKAGKICADWVLKVTERGDQRGNKRKSQRG